MAPSSLELKDKHILVTGAAGGIGHATVQLLASLGAKLTAMDIKPMDATVAALRAEGVDIDAFEVDLSKPFTLPEQRLSDLYGIVALAGIFLTDDWMADDDWEATFNHVLNTNVLSMLRMFRICMPILERNGTGRVVLVGSTTGRHGGSPRIAQPHYAVTRGGVHALTYNLAKRYGPKGIQVNCVAPGTIGTERNAKNFPPGYQFAAGRMGTAMEVAWPIAFLCSPHVSYISGAILDVNGGSFMG